MLQSAKIMNRVYSKGWDKADQVIFSRNYEWIIGNKDLPKARLQARIANAESKLKDKRLGATKRRYLHVVLRFLRGYLAQ